MSDAVVETPAPAAREVLEYLPAVALDKLTPCPLNPRKTFDNARLVEFSQSIKSKGILQPLVVRPNGKAGIYEIICGERRWRAARLAGLAEVPVNVHEYSDADALEVMAIENGQRDDVLPLEEARGYADLIKTGRYDVVTLARKIGKSESYVHGRLVLLKLPAPVAKALEAGRISVDHAHLIAALPKNWHEAALRTVCQEVYFEGEAPRGVALLEEPGEVEAALPIADFRKWIKRTVYCDLKAAPWDLKDDTLLPRTKATACCVCPKNSACKQDLFAEKDEQLCEDGACYQAKLDAHTQRTIATKRQQGETIVPITDAWKANAKEGDPIGRNQWEETKANAKGAVKAIYTEGAKKGKEVFVKLTKDAPKNVAAAGEKSEKAPRPLAERRKELAKRRQAWTCEYLAETASDKRSVLRMPRWASRITLEVVDIRAQRVQEINRMEGAQGPNYRASFCKSWDSINAPRGYGWDANPWVWVHTFKRVPSPSSVSPCLRGEKEARA